MTREEEIKRAWANYRLPWPQNGDGTPKKALVIANPGPMPDGPWMSDTKSISTPVDDRFVFEREDGFQDGTPATRIMCEGVMVAIWYRR